MAIQEKSFQPADYQKYVQRGPDSYVNWEKMSQDVTKLFMDEASRRENIKADIDDRTQSLYDQLAEVEVKRFSDGEINVNITESVRGQDVFIIQPTCAPANDNLMELLIIVDALKRSSAGTINAVIPYFGYARQDRKAAPRVPISAKLVADMLETAGVQRVITIDLRGNPFWTKSYRHLL